MVNPCPRCGEAPGHAADCQFPMAAPKTVTVQPGMSDDKLVERVARQADPEAWKLFDEGRQTIALYARIEQSRKTTRAAIAALQSERASMEGEIERLREALSDLVFSCDGLEWSSFTQPGWDSVKRAREVLTSSKTGDE